MQDHGSDENTRWEVVDVYFRAGGGIFFWQFFFTNLCWWTAASAMVTINIISAGRILNFNITEPMGGVPKVVRY